MLPQRHIAKRSSIGRMITMAMRDAYHPWRSVRRIFSIGVVALVACDPAPQSPPASTGGPAPSASAATSQWSAMLDQAPSLATQKFYFVMAASAISLGGLSDVEKQYPVYYSRTMRVGVAVPILYLRTTLGATNDWTFDADFSIAHRCKTRAVAEDSLNGLIQFAIDHQMPVQFILNGGVWANSSCEAAEWDIADQLEKNVGNCQWTQDNRVYPRDYLKNLAGSIESPELARSLTFN